MQPSLILTPLVYLKCGGVYYDIEGGMLEESIVLVKVFLSFMHVFVHGWMHAYTYVCLYFNYVRM